MGEQTSFMATILFERSSLRSYVLIFLSLCVPFIAEAQSRARATVESQRATAVARRDAEFAAAASLTSAQAHTAFDQMRTPAYGPRWLDVRVDARPDGTRHVFAFVEIDRAAECVVASPRWLSLAEARSDCRGVRGTYRIVFLVQVDPRGRVFRTRLHVPFATPANRPDDVQQGLRPVSMRLIAPAEGEHRIAIIEGERSLPASRGMDAEPATFDHHVSLWAGDAETVLRLASVCQPNHPYVYDERLAALTLDEAGHRLVRVAASCEDGCRCSRPSTIAQEATQLARAAPASNPDCRPTETTLPWPANAHLVDVDLDARTPTGTRDEALAAGTARTASVLSVSEETASRILGQTLPLTGAPQLGAARIHARSDGSREFFLTTERSDFLECVFELGVSTSRYDRVRACAHLTSVSTVFVYGELAPDGSLRGSAHGTRALTNVVATAVLAPSADAPAVWLFETFGTERVGTRPPFFRHVVEAMGAQGRTASASIGGTDGTPISAHPTAGRIGELVVDPTGASALLRVADCTEACPCDPLPETVEAERALLHAREASVGSRCAVRSVAYGPLR